MKLNSGTL